MSRMVRRLAAVAVVTILLGVPGLSFAAVPVDQGQGDSPAGYAGFGEVLYDLWAWIGAVFGSDEAGSGTGGEEQGGAAGDPPPESNAENEDPPAGGNGDSGGTADPTG